MNRGFEAVLFPGDIEGFHVYVSHWLAYPGLSDKWKGVWIQAGLTVLQKHERTHLLLFPECLPVVESLSNW